jgi:hypothetical protein
MSNALCSEWLSLKDVQQLLGIGRTKAYESSLPPASCPLSGSGGAFASTAGTSMNGCWLSATWTRSGTTSFWALRRIDDYD